MNRVKVFCGLCHADPVVPAKHISVMPLTSEFEFTCPFCQRTSVGDTDMVEQLIAAGAVVVRPEYPEVIPEGLGPLTLDDLIAFHFEMEEAL